MDKEDIYYSIEIIYDFSLQTPKIVFCRPNGIGVSLANNTTLNARGPAITRRMARPVSFFINL